MAISWQEIKAWADLTGSTLSGREFQAMRRLSAAYVDEYHRTNGKDCHGPCVDVEKTAEKVESKMKTLFAMLRGPKDD